MVKPSFGTTLLGLSLLAGCGGGGGSPTQPPPPAALSVGGAYTVAVALDENSCGPVTVATQPTSVSHTPGAGRFSLTHGPNTFQGSVATDGAFTTDPLALADGATALTVAIQGRFTTTGLNSTVTVNEDRPAPTSDCRYTVQWTGTKQGAPNVIP